MAGDNVRLGLSWQGYKSAFMNMLRTWLENGKMVDCTLVAEGQYLKAHKLVLMASSPYLELLLSQHNAEHPILTIKDVKFQELKSIIDYMYRGKVYISQKQLSPFLKAARSLQIRGLFDGGNEDSTPSTTPSEAPFFTPDRNHEQQADICGSSLNFEEINEINFSGAGPSHDNSNQGFGQCPMSGNQTTDEVFMSQKGDGTPSISNSSSDVLIEPKTEYFEQLRDDEYDMENSMGMPRIIPSHDNSKQSVGQYPMSVNQTTDEVFMSQKRDGTPTPTSPAKAPIPTLVKKTVQQSVTICRLTVEQLLTIERRLNNSPIRSCNESALPTPSLCRSKQQRPSTSNVPEIQSNYSHVHSLQSGAPINKTAPIKARSPTQVIEPFQQAITRGPSTVEQSLMKERRPKRSLKRSSNDDSALSSPRKRRRHRRRHFMSDWTTII